MFELTRIFYNNKYKNQNISPYIILLAFLSLPFKTGDHGRHYTNTKQINFHSSTFYFRVRSVLQAFEQLSCTYMWICVCINVQKWFACRHFDVALTNVIRGCMLCIIVRPSFCEWGKWRKVGMKEIELFFGAV